MNTTLFALLFAHAQAAPAIEGVEVANDDSSRCAVVVDASPLVRGSRQARMVRLGIADDSGSLMLPVHVTHESVQRAPVWGDLIALDSADVGTASRAVADEEAVTGVLVPPHGLCLSADGMQQPFAAFELTEANEGVAR